MRFVQFAVVMLVLSARSFAEEPKAASGSEKQEDVATPIDVWEFRIVGNTVLPVMEIERAVSPFLGPQRAFTDLDNAKTALEKAYREHGHPTVFVDLPEQNIQGGVVQLNVTEGVVERLKVSGSKYHSLKRIRETVPSLAEGTVPHFPSMQRELTQLQGADQQVAPLLRAGRTPGKVEVELKVKDQVPFHGSAELNNRYSANTTKTRFYGGLRYDNLWQLRHSISLNYQVAPEKASESQVFSSTYVMPAGDKGNLLALYAVKSESDVAAVGDVTVLGKGNILGMRAIFPLPQRGKLFHSWTLGLDLKDFDESTTVSGAGTIPTPVKYVPLSLQYSATLQGEKGASTQFGVGVTFGLRGLSDRQVDCTGTGDKQDQFTCKRFGARPNFSYLKGSIGHTQPLPNDWGLSAKLEGQLAGQPLISNEQFAVGGVESVHGYLESEASGDHGLLGRVEVRTPTYALAEEFVASDMTGVAFIEAAELRLKDPLPGESEKSHLLGAGIGARWKSKLGFSALLDLGWPFEATRSTQSGDVRAHFRLGYEF